MEQQRIAPDWKNELTLRSMDLYRSVENSVFTLFRASHRAKLGWVVRDGLQRHGRLAEIALLAISILSLEDRGLCGARQALERL